LGTVELHGDRHRSAGSYYRVLFENGRAATQEDECTSSSPTVPGLLEDCLEYADLHLFTAEKPALTPEQEEQMHHRAC
jgi:hypothetical protein